MQNRQASFILDVQLNPVTCLKVVPFLEEAMSGIAVIATSADLLNEMMALTNNDAHKNLLQEFLPRHIADSYSGKVQLMQYLSLIVHYLKQHHEERDHAISALIQDIQNCTPGFHDRVYVVMCSFFEPKSIDELLAVMRRNLVEKAYYLGERHSSSEGEVHTHHRFFVVAMALGYAIHGDLTNDPHHGRKSDDQISREIANVFREYYTPQGILNYIWEGAPFGKYGYVGRLSSGSYTSGMYERVLTFLRTIFNNSFLTMQHCLVIENDCVIDINWPKISSLLLYYLHQHDYLKIGANAQVHTIEHEGKRLSLVLSGDNILHSRLRYSFTNSEGEPESYHMLFSQKNINQDFSILPYFMLRNFLILFLMNPLTLSRASTLAILDHLIADGDLALNQNLDQKIAYRLQNDLFPIEIISRMSARRLQRAYDLMTPEVQAMFINRLRASLDWLNILPEDNHDKVRFISQVLGARLAAELVAAANISDVLNAISAGASPATCLVICQSLQVPIEAKIISLQQICVMMVHLNANMAAAIGELYAARLQQYFTSIQDFVYFFLDIKSSAALHRLVLSGEKHRIMYKALRSKILLLLQQNMQSSARSQLISIQSLIRVLPIVLKKEFLKDFDDHLIVLLKNMTMPYLMSIIDVFEDADDIRHILVKLRGSPSSPYRQKRFTTIELSGMGTEERCVNALEPFCEVFKENIVASFVEGSASFADMAIGRRIHADMSDDAFELFCLAMKSSLLTIIPSLQVLESIISLVPNRKCGRVKKLLNILGEDMGVLVRSGADLQPLLNLYKGGFITTLDRLLANILVEKINSLEILKAWMQHVNNDDKHLLMARMAGDKVVSLVTLPDELQNLLLGGESDLRLANMVLKLLPTKVVVSTLQRMPAATKAQLATLPSLKILLLNMPVSHIKAMCNLLPDISINLASDFESFLGWLSGFREPSVVLNKFTTALVSAVSNINDVPNLRSSNNAYQCRLIYVILRSKIVSLITSLSDFRVLERVLYDSQCKGIFDEVKAVIAPHMNHWRDVPASSSTSSAGLFATRTASQSDLADQSVKRARKG